MHLKMTDGTELYVKDWGSGQPVVFIHGWPLSSDAFEDQMMYLASRGYRCVGYDRRGFGRSSQPWANNTYDTFAQDLSEVIGQMNLEDVVLVGHSMGGGEIARYIGKYGSAKISRTVFIGSVTPVMVESGANPNGAPMEIFDGMREMILSDRSQFFKDFTKQVYSVNLLGSNVSQGVREAFWRLGMQSGLKNAFDCVKAFSETDFTSDLRKFDIPTLFIHGNDDKVVPLAGSAELAVKLVPGAELHVYEGASHGLCTTHKDQLNEDLLAFISGRTAAAVN